MNIAHITGLDLAPDGVFLVRAVCDRCRRDVMHGAGSDLDNLALGDRRAHCVCAGSSYELVDRNNVIPRRVAEIREELAEKARRRAEARARRAAQ